VNWNLFLTELLAGLTHGAVYALIALGYSMVYGVLKLLNFAHGDVYMLGSYVGFGLIGVFNGPAHLSISVWLLLFLMVACAMLAGGLLGVAIERYAYRRLRNAPRAAPLITALGVSFFLENAALLVLGANFQSYNTFALGAPSGRPAPLWAHGFTLPTGVHVALAQTIVIAGALVLMFGLTLFVDRTRTGKAMRAVALDREAASMMGVDIDRVIVTTFFIGSALAGAAGVFNGIVYQQVWPYMGFQAGLKAFTAAVVGGIGNLPGAALGGFVIGLAEAFTTGYVSSTFQDATVFALLIAVMIARPSGLLGRAAVQKV
jgi:branched-chain amino acid transport system permease protein